MVHGTASLADVRATFCGSIRSIPTILALRRSVAATTRSWRGVAAHLGLAVIVDAREVVGHATQGNQALGMPYIGAFQAADRGSASSAPRGARMTVA